MGWGVPSQILGSIGSVGGGLALGKEGPLVHTGACIASVLGQVSSASAIRMFTCFISCRSSVYFRQESHKTACFLLGICKQG